MAGPLKVMLTCSLWSSWDFWIWRSWCIGWDDMVTLCGHPHHWSWSLTGTQTGFEKRHNFLWLHGPLCDLWSLTLDHWGLIWCMSIKGHVEVRVCLRIILSFPLNGTTVANLGWSVCCFIASFAFSSHWQRTGSSHGASLRKLCLYPSAKHDGSWCHAHRL